MPIPSTSLTIEAKRPPLGAFVTPTAEINGYRVPLHWGTNVIPAQPGVHQIRIYMPWLWRFGHAEIVIDNRAAPAPVVYYAMPWVNFLPGAIGVTPVKQPGLGAMLVVAIVPVGLVALCCGAAVLSGW